MPFRAVVFDFDGVIANTEPLHLKAAQDVLQEERIPLTADDYYARYLGFDDAGLLRAVCEAAGRRVTTDAVRDLVERKARVVQRLIDDGLVLFAGARECIERCARRVPLAIASGALRGEIEGILERTGLRAAFDTIVGAEDTPRTKPAPDPYALAVARLRERHGPELTADNCVAIEDSQWGVESARAAGLRCVAVTHTYPAETFPHVQLVASNLAEITIDELERLWTETN